MADISIDEARAKIWVDDVNAELRDIEMVLKKVESSLTTAAGTDDSIMNGIYNVAKVMENAWNKMCADFRSAQDKLEEAIKALVKSGKEAVEDADTLKSKMAQ